MKKILLSATILFLAAACNKAAPVKSENHSTSTTNLPPITVTSSDGMPVAQTGVGGVTPQIQPGNNQAYIYPEDYGTNSQSQADYDKQRTDMVKESIDTIKHQNDAFLTSPTGQYSGLPIPSEDDQSIQSYVRLADSSSGGYSLYALVTYSKSPNDINDMMGGLGTIDSARPYICNVKTKSCQESLEIEAHQSSGLVGYYENPIFNCIVGWDAENNLIYSIDCGEGGAQSTFTKFDYHNDKKSKISGSPDNSHYLGINKGLTKVAMEEYSPTGSSDTLEIYSTADLSKPFLAVDLLKLKTPTSTPDPNGGLEEIRWSDEQKFTFMYNGADYSLDTNSGLVSKQD